MTDPSNLTVDRLKKELDQHSVRYNKTAKKDELVELYRRHIGSGSTNHGHFDFSSDEDSFAASKTGKGGGYRTVTSSVTVTERKSQVSRGGVDVGRLTDDDLVSMLEERGADVGPITETTRVVYRNKLLKLLNSDRRPQTSKPVSRPPTKDSEEEDDDDDKKHNADYSDDDDADAETQQQPLSQWTNSQSDEFRKRQLGYRDSPLRTSAFAATRNNDSLSEGHSAGSRTTTTTVRNEYSSLSSSGRQFMSSGDSASLSRPSLSSTTASSGQTKATGAKGGGIPVWLQLLLLILLSGFLFLVLQNLDPTWIYQMRGGGDASSAASEAKQTA